MQNEQQQVYILVRTENQIVDDLRNRLNKFKSGRDDDIQVEIHLRYFENLKKMADENIRMLDDWSGTITLRQTIDGLPDMGIVKNKMPDTMREYVAAQKVLESVSRTGEATQGRFRTLLEAQLGSIHQQMQMFNQWMEQTVHVSGGLILATTALVLLPAWVFNHYFTRSRLVKRFILLNQAVVQIGLGDTETTILAYGNDEPGRITGLLRRTLGQLNIQEQRLEQEVTDCKVIEVDLRATQDELTQTAKLAIAGQMMTTLVYETNQPLSALSMYLFTVRRVIEQTQKEQASMMLGKAGRVISYTDAIIRLPRQFTRCAGPETSLHAVDLAQMLSAAWGLPAMRHRSLQVTLVLLQGTVIVLGDEVRTQQILANVLANALDVCGQGAAITVNWQMQGKTLNIFVGDNGPGWPKVLLPLLLKPFTTSKEVGLGIGLSVRVSLMEQMKGELRLVSTVTRSACVVLQFRLMDVEDAKQ